MTDKNATASKSAIVLPDPASAPELFEDLLTRRVLAYLVDVALIGLIVLVLGVFGILLGVFTFGLAWFAMPLIVPVGIGGYYVLTLASGRGTTLGMRLADIGPIPVRQGAIDGWKILLHPLLFWLSIWICWPITLLAALFTPRRQMLHDLALGVLVVRKSPLASRGDNLRGASSQRA